LDGKYSKIHKSKGVAYVKRFITFRLESGEVGFINLFTGKKRPIALEDKRVKGGGGERGKSQIWRSIDELSGGIKRDLDWDEGLKQDPPEKICNRGGFSV